MDTTITIRDTEYRFVVNAATTYLYKQTFGKDLIREFEKAQKEEATDSIEMLTELAFVTARQADKTIPNDIGEWLSNFSMMELYKVILPEISKLWQKNLQTDSVPKNR